jgi:hypothetical protein
MLQRLLASCVLAGSLAARRLSAKRRSSQSFRRRAAGQCVTRFSPLPAVTERQKKVRQSSTQQTEGTHTVGSSDEFEWW